MHIAVVGGGITGSVAAFECLLRGHTVDLYEKSPALGGVMKDHWVDGSFYFNGCHYLDRGTAWFERLRERLDPGFRDFVHEYGSLTEFGGSLTRHDDFAQPVMPGKFEGLATTDDGFASVAHRLSAYPQRISAFLTEWASGFGDLKRLGPHCIFPMQVGRVFFPDDLATVLEAKAGGAAADQLLGVPRSILFQGKPKETGSLPRSGFDAFFAHLRSKLVDMGGNIFTRTPVAPMADSTAKLRFRASGADVQADRTIWCCNPTPLLIKSGFGKLDAPVTRMYCSVGTLTGRAPLEPIYYQIFSERSSVVRIFIYELDGLKVTVEGFDRKQDTRQVAAEIQRHLDQLNLGVTFQPKGIELQRRYSFSTNEDVRKIEEFSRAAPRLGMLDGKWHHYSRDVKIAALVEAIEKWGNG